MVNIFRIQYSLVAFMLVINFFGCSIKAHDGNNKLKINLKINNDFIKVREDATIRSDTCVLASTLQDAENDDNPNNKQTLIKKIACAGKNFIIQKNSGLNDSLTGNEACNRLQIQDAINCVEDIMFCGEHSLEILLYYCDNTRFSSQFTSSGFCMLSSEPFVVILNKPSSLLQTVAHEVQHFLTYKYFIGQNIKCLYMFDELLSRYAENCALFSAYKSDDIQCHKRSIYDLNIYKNFNIDAFIKKFQII